MDQLKFSFDDNFQLGIFELMLSDSNFCGKCTSLLRPDFFKNEYYSWFYETIKTLYSRDGASPSTTQLKNEVLKIRSEKKEYYISVYDRIIKPTMLRDYDYIKENLSSFCQTAILWHINRDLVKNKHNNPDESIKMLRKKFEEFSSASFEETPFFSLKDIKSRMEKSANQQLIPLFMPDIDRALGGGVPKESLFLALAGTNVGKSIFLMNWSYHLIKAKFKVLVVTLEGTKDQFMFRLAARALRIPYGSIKNNNLSDTQMVALNAFIKELQSNVEFLHDSTFGQCIEDLVPKIKEKKRVFDFDVVMLDYGQVLKTKESLSELRHKQSVVHQGLSALSGELGILIASVVQGTRDTQVANSDGKRLVRMNDVAECFEVMRTAATVCTINISDTDRQDQRMRFLLDKQRDGMTGVIQVCKTEMSTMAMYGTYEEGLGFITTSDYAKESSEK